MCEDLFGSFVVAGKVTITVISRNSNQEMIGKRLLISL